MAISYLTGTVVEYVGAEATYSIDLTPFQSLVRHHDLLILSFMTARPGTTVLPRSGDPFIRSTSGTSPATDTERAVAFSIEWMVVGSDGVIPDSIVMTAGGDGRPNVAILDIFRGCAPGGLAANVKNTSGTSRRPGYFLVGEVPVAQNSVVYAVGFASGPAAAADHTNQFNASQVVPRQYGNLGGTSASICVGTASKLANAEGFDASMGTWSATDSDANSRARAFMFILPPALDVDLAPEASFGAFILGIEGDMAFTVPSRGGVRRSGARRLYLPEDPTPTRKWKKPKAKPIPEDLKEQDVVKVPETDGVAEIANVPTFDHLVLPGAEIGEALKRTAVAKAKQQADNEAALLLLLLT